MDCICISHPCADADGVNLVCRAETRLLLTGVEPGQDTLSGILQQQGVRVGPESSLSARGYLLRWTGWKLNALDLGQSVIV